MKLTMEDVKRMHAGEGGHFFDRDSMEFWGSKIESELIGNLFVTSEHNFDRTERRFTVRSFNEDTCDIEDFSEFQQFTRLDDALQFVYDNM